MTEFLKTSNVKKIISSIGLRSKPGAVTKLRDLAEGYLCDRIRMIADELQKLKRKTVTEKDVLWLIDTENKIDALEKMQEQE